MRGGGAQPGSVGSREQSKVESCTGRGKFAREQTSADCCFAATNFRQEGGSSRSLRIDLLRNGVDSQSKAWLKGVGSALSDSHGSLENEQYYHCQLGFSFFRDSQRQDPLHHPHFTARSSTGSSHFTEQGWSKSPAFAKPPTICLLLQLLRYSLHKYSLLNMSKSIRVNDAMQL